MFSDYCNGFNKSCVFLQIPKHVLSSCRGQKINWEIISPPDHVESLCVCLQAVVGFFLFLFVFFFCGSLSTDPWKPGTKPQFIFLFCEQMANTKDNYRRLDGHCPDSFWQFTIILRKIQLVPGVWLYVIIDAFPGVLDQIYSINPLSNSKDSRSLSPGHTVPQPVFVFSEITLVAYQKKLYIPTREFIT